MKTLLILAIVLITNICLAGGVGGGGVLSIGADQKEMIYSKGNDGQNMVYVRATWENGKWNMKEESLILRDFNSPIHNAIKESDSTRNWAKVERK